MAGNGRAEPCVRRLPERGQRQPAFAVESKVDVAFFQDFNALRTFSTDSPAPEPIVEYERKATFGLRI